MLLIVDEEWNDEDEDEDDDASPWLETSSSAQKDTFLKLIVIYSQRFRIGTYIDDL